MWFNIILCLIFLTPIGWIGMISFGVAISMIVGAKSEERKRLIHDIQHVYRLKDSVDFGAFIDELE